jgi:hypothetical protein
MLIILGWHYFDLCVVCLCARVLCFVCVSFCVFSIRKVKINMKTQQILMLLFNFYHLALICFLFSSTTNREKSNYFAHLSLFTSLIIFKLKIKLFIKCALLFINTFFILNVYILFNFLVDDVVEVDISI